MKKIAIAALLLAQLALAASAGAVQMFDFDAQAVLPTVTGDPATACGIIVNGQAVDTPLPLDFANFQYTIVVSDLVLQSSGSVSILAGGTVAIYQDDVTAAAWADPSSFADGTAILVGSLATLQHAMLTATLGSAAGAVDWTGGSRLDELAPADRTGWPFLTAVSRAADQVQPGFTERWDGKVEPENDVVASEPTSWSGVKVLFN